MDPDPELIRAEDDLLTWGMILHQLTEAHTHLGQLISDIQTDSQFDEVDAMIQLGHIYAHLNRFWHGRTIPGGNIDAMYTDENSSFPDDVTLT